MTTTHDRSETPRPQGARRRAGRHLPRGVSRRDILQYGMAGMGLTALGPLSGWVTEARAAPATQTFLVVVFLYGGNDATNMVVPRTLGNYYTRRPTIAIPAGSELSLNAGPAATTGYGLHPRFVNMRTRYANGELALVNLVGYPDANLSHFTSQDIYSYAVRGAFADLGLDQSGWIARYADLYAPTSMGAVSVGVGRPLDLVGGSSNPFLVNSLAPFKFNSDPNYPDNHIHRIEAIRDILDGFSGTGVSGDVAAALDQGHELAGLIQDAVANYSSSVVYQATDGITYNIHRYLRDVATLVSYGFETRVFYTGFGGFDTHANQGAATGNQGNLFDRLDTALEAFAQDMQAMGVWNNTVVVVASEFGRRNYENGSGGTDHGEAAAFLVLGGGVNGGVYGPDVTTAHLDEESLLYEVDFRDIYREVVADHLGDDASPVFPEAQPKNTVLGLV